MPAGVLIALISGFLLLIVGIVAMTAYAFRGQQTGAQKTDVGIANANALKGTQVQTLVTGGGSLPLLSR